MNQPFLIKKSIITYLRCINWLRTQLKRRCYKMQKYRYYCPELFFRYQKDTNIFLFFLMKLLSWILKSFDANGTIHGFCWNYLSTSQFHINFASMLLMDVENETKFGFRLLMLHKVDTKSVSNVETTLSQCCFILLSRLLEAILKPIRLVLNMYL